MAEDRGFSTMTPDEQGADEKRRDEKTGTEGTQGGTM
jgi:hypothetical protein